MNENPLLFLIASASVFVLAGCTADGPPLERSEYNTVGDTLRLSPARYDLYQKGQFRDAYDAAALKCSTEKDEKLKAVDEAQAEAARNQILIELTGAVDLGYNQYYRDITNGNEVALWAGDVANVGLTAAATVTSSASLAKLLAGIATGLSASKLAYEKKILKDQTIEFLVRQMETDRATAKKTILDGTKTTIANYSLEQGILDVWAYYNVGNIPHALSEIDQKLAKSASDISPDDIDNLIKVQAKLKELDNPSPGGGNTGGANTPAATPAPAKTNDPKAAGGQ